MLIELLLPCHFWHLSSATKAHHALPAALPEVAGTTGPARRTANTRTRSFYDQMGVSVIRVLLFKGTILGSPIFGTSHVLECTTSSAAVLSPTSPLHPPTYPPRFLQVPTYRPTGPLPICNLPTYHAPTPPARLPTYIPTYYRPTDLSPYTL